MGGKREDTASERTRKLKSNKLNLRISDDELAILNTISFEDVESVSQIVRKAIRTYDAIRRNKKKFE